MLGQGSRNVNLLAIMEASPVPTFAMTQERQVFAYNAAFGTEFVPAASAAAGGKEFRLVFNRPLNQTINRLKAGKTNTTSGYVGLVSGRRFEQRRVKFCLINAEEDASPLLVFVEPKRQA